MATTRRSRRITPLQTIPGTLFEGKTRGVGPFSEDLTSHGGFQERLRIHLQGVCERIRIVRFLDSSSVFTGLHLSSPVFTASNTQDQLPVRRVMLSNKGQSLENRGRLLKKLGVFRMACRRPMHTW